MTAPAAASQNAYGQRVYWVPDEQGRQRDLPSASTVLKVLDAPALTTWKLKAVAREVSHDEKLAEKARENEYGAAMDALERQRGAADLGTSVHAATEEIDRDGKTALDFPETIEAAGEHYPFRGYLHAYEAFKRDWQIRVLEIEQTVFNHKIGYAGTLDRIMTIGVDPQLPGIEWDTERPVIGDVKTGKGVWPEAAMQLAGYTRGEGIWDPGSKTKRPLPEGLRQDVAFAIHLAEDHYELIPLDLRYAWRALRAVTAAWEWVNVDARSAVGRPLAWPGRNDLFIDREEDALW